MKNYLAVFARILFALPFDAFGMSHLFRANDLAEKLPGWLPGGVVWIYFTGVCLVLACVAFVAKIQGQKAAFGLALFLVIVIIMLHVPALKGGNPQMARMNLLQRYKPDGRRIDLRDTLCCRRIATADCGECDK